MRFALAIGAVTTAAAALAPQGQRPSVVVGSPVQVSAARATDTHYEVVAAADPTNARHLLAASLLYPDTGASWASVVYRSTDGGATWRPALEGAPLDRTGDPALAFGPDGSAYYVASRIPASGDRTLVTFRATPRAGAWQPATSLTYMDRQYVVVDETHGPRRGTVYVNGNNRVPRTVSDFVVHRSADGGATWTGPGTRADFGSATATVMGNAVVLADGTLVGVYVRGERGAGGSTLRAIRSTDGGSTLADEAVIDTYVAGGERKGPSIGNATAEPVLAVDATSGPHAGRLYVAWPDRRAGHADILFASSSDGGRRWTSSRIVSDAPAGTETDQFMPAIAVSRDGTVGLTWYDRRDRPDNLGWEVRFAASVDGGTTWTPSVRVSPEGSRFPPGTTRARPPAPPQPSPRDQVNAGRDSFRFMGGDTAGLVADAAGDFHAVWVDNHSGVPQLWTARIQVRGAVSPGGR